MDAATKETYEKIRLGGNFILARKNVEELIKLKSENSVDRLAIDLQFIVMPENFHEVLLFAEHWAKVFERNHLGYILNSKHDGLVSENTISFVVRHPVTEESLGLHSKACELLELNEINKKDLTGEL